MASGHVNRIKRPNTWLHRPTCKREKSSCQHGAVHTWHETDMPTALRDVRSQGQSGKHLLALSFSGFDLGCVKTCAHETCAELFSLVLSRQPSPAPLFFKMIEVKTKFPFANSISEFSRNQDPLQKSAIRLEPFYFFEAFLDACRSAIHFRTGAALSRSPIFCWTACLLHSSRS